MNRSVLVFRIVLGLLFITLVVSLFRLQVIRGAYYKEVAELNFVRIRRVTATRGEIYDNKYRPIVVNIPSHNLYLVSGKIRNLQATAKFLHYYFGLTPQDLQALVFKQRFKTYEEILLADNIPYETVLSLSEQLNFYPELSFRIGTTRSYQYPNHFTGYVSRINEDEYARYKDEDYSLNSYIGKTGLESYYEVLLRGKDGKEIVQVDSRGRSLDLFRSEGSIEPQNGLSLVLTIDNDLQRLATEVFPKAYRGALVVMDARSGGILAYYSNPGFDPNVFMNRISPEVWAEMNNSTRPMMDRVIHAAYPPGSVFKPLTSEIGLQQSMVNRNTHLASCVGGMKVGNRFFKCWSSSGHGSLDVVNALKVSCDVYFYDLSLKVKLDDFYKYAYDNYLCVKTGIDLPNERDGFFPNSEYYRKKLGRANTQGYKVNLSIGQGEVLTTPLQITAFYAALANGGLWTQPHLLKQSVGTGKLTRDQVDKVKTKRLPISAANLAIIQEGLFAVCNAPGGTGRNVVVNGAKVYGKTGSAENSMGSQTHAWFTGYIVTDKPEIVVNVFMENAGGGGAVAGPVAAKIFNYYIGNLERIKKEVPLPRQFQDPEQTAAGPEPESGELPPEVIPETPPVQEIPGD
ncbi:MAG TPA: penicillin-binding protein 2 [Candidatus Cloacimonadota bacterium]|nr:penicillin-binding protein 2 [Candidatus Cloacimonadota bacterium]